MKVSLEVLAGGVLVVTSGIGMLVVVDAVYRQGWTSVGPRIWPLVAVVGLALRFVSQAWRETPSASRAVLAAPRERGSRGRIVPVPAEAEQQ